MEIKVKIEPNWIGEYRLLREGKDLHLEGCDKNEPDQWDRSPQKSYIPVTLMHVCELRYHEEAKIVKIDEQYIYIEIRGDEKEISKSEANE